MSIEKTNSMAPRRGFFVEATEEKAPDEYVVEVDLGPVDLPCWLRRNPYRRPEPATTGWRKYASIIAAHMIEFAIPALIVIAGIILLGDIFYHLVNYGN